jgi:hypothetical protein
MYRHVYFCSTTTRSVALTTLVNTNYISNTVTRDVETLSITLLNVCDVRCAIQQISL